MARSGSTLLCKCLGCMDEVALLSELHPLAWQMFNPLKQAQEWFGLVTQEDIAGLQKQGRASYAQAIALIERRSRERGMTLVLRDWAHLDYTGLPFVKEPGFRPLLYVELADSFDIVRLSTARDPVTQWQSLIQLAVMREPLGSGAFNLKRFLAGYLKYAGLCLETGYVRYEDLLRNPEQTMRDVCERLDIRFDPEFINKWYGYRTITGDVVNPRTSNRIAMPPKRPVDPALKEQFLANADYHRICGMLDYEILA